MHTRIHHVQVLCTINFSIRIHHYPLLPFRPHLSSANVVTPCFKRFDQVGGGHVSRTSGRCDDAEGRVGSRCHGDEAVQHKSDGFLVHGRVHVRFRHKSGGACRGDAQATHGLQAVGDVDFHLYLVVGGRVAGTLKKDFVAGRGVYRGPPVKALAGFGKEAGTLGEEVDGCGVGSDEGGFVGGGEGGAGFGGAGFEFDGEDGVVFDFGADGEVNPGGAGGQFDARGAAGDGLELGGGSDARVEEDAGGGHGAGGEKDAASGFYIVDDSLASGSLYLDARYGLTVTDSADDIGVHHELEVLELLGERKIGPHDTRTKAISHVPWRVAKDILLGVWILDEVGFGPSLGGEELGKHAIRSVVIADAVLGAICLSGVALVDAVSSG
ncbi:hypothetical protein GMOD_00009933 [Pyrenophora seminiperda CCB06]|uniref:Uncharacterized protein n=1 Tax=Pyrenophora seminiperda CCB06 TaxID=1302712 RepID=A0A3M7M1D4_9PLEO|nr:hypothetical protein GMOD_00009933 [Pyrenophora seminiperda CCB06]